ncbi:succinylglutamate desuccinylase/aspartoacylase family protein, partial [Xanthomonas citri pv. citri]
YHNTKGGTFTQFRCSAHQAFSATLELGKAKPFGQNDLRQFASIDRVLRAIISGQTLPTRQTAAIRVFDVSDSIIKQSDEFVLYVEPTAPNFTAFEAGTPLATDGGQTYVMHDGTAYILFPNPNVAKGLRAGLVLKERMA